MEKAIERTSTRLAQAPPGKIRYVYKNGNLQIYLRMDSKDKCGKYIRQAETDRISPYLQKQYDEKVLKYLEQECSKIQILLNRHCSSKADSHNKTDDENLIKNCYSSLPELVKNYVEPIDLSDEEFAERWQNIPFTGKPFLEDFSSFKTNRGEIVRSKSELTIANALFQKNIPYKYECPLELRRGLTVYPDFTILNTSTRKVYYWEHRGMMDDREYAKHAVLKQKEYMRAGIFPGDALILTEETATNPLSTQEIAETIKHFLI